MLVPLRNLPHGFVELLSIKSGSLLLRHSCGFSSRVVTKQGSGNFCPLSSPCGTTWCAAAPQKNSNLRRSWITQNFGRSVVQIRCSCAKKKKKIPTSPCTSRCLETTSSTTRARIRKLSLDWLSLNFSPCSGLALPWRAETRTRTSLRHCALAAAIIFSRELGRYWETRGYPVPAADSMSGNLPLSIGERVVPPSQLNDVIAAYGVYWKISYWKMIISWRKNAAIMQENDKKCKK